MTDAEIETCLDHTGTSYNAIVALRDGLTEARLGELENEIDAVFEAIETLETQIANAREAQ